MDTRLEEKMRGKREVLITLLVLTCPVSLTDASPSPMGSIPKDTGALRWKMVTYSQVYWWAGDGAAQQPQYYSPPGPPSDSFSPWYPPVSGTEADTALPDLTDGCFFFSFPEIQLCMSDKA